MPIGIALMKSAPPIARAMITIAGMSQKDAYGNRMFRIVQTYEFPKYLPNCHPNANPMTCRNHVSAPAKLLHSAA